jgi:diaminopimelate decarboxylase
VLKTEQFANDPVNVLAKEKHFVVKNFYATLVKEIISPLGTKIEVEPGRSIVGNAGLLVSRIINVKQGVSRKFVIVDAAMNDLLRPSLYDAYHEIIPAQLDANTVRHETVDVVGPICESGDFFARGRELPVVNEGALLAILDAGAYGMALASNYNTRRRPAEVLVDGKSVKLIRRRETMDDLMRPELQLR